MTNALHTNQRSTDLPVADSNCSRQSPGGHRTPSAARPIPASYENRLVPRVKVTQIQASVTPDQSLEPLRCETRMVKPKGRDGEPNCRALYRHFEDVMIMLLSGELNSPLLHVESSRFHHFQRRPVTDCPQRICATFSSLHRHKRSEYKALRSNPAGGRTWHQACNSSHPGGAQHL